MIDENREERPDPEALLKAIQRAENQEKSGKLKIFFGMAAGVGKTFEMLKAAQQKLDEGVDVVSGVVETHGRRETKALLEGLPQIPEKRVQYRNTSIGEMDLETILQRRPQLVLVDELAHTNAPGSRHPKRWQDVVELLDAGIDVYTTINVQHIESRKEVVETIAGISIREMVPDSIIERANDIELIDITPQELLMRLKEGKVYLGPQAEIAARNFFQEDRLTALREIALRFTAEKVEHDLHGMISAVPAGKAGWRPGEKLMVAVSHSPNSQQLIRAARRIAFNLDCSWIAVHVDNGIALNSTDTQTLAKNLELARELGAEIITTSDTDIFQAIQRVARQQNVTQIVLGRSPPSKIRDFFRRSSLLDRLASEATDINLYVVSQEAATEQETPTSSTSTVSTPTFQQSSRSHFSDYLWVFAVITSLTVVSWFISPFIHYQVIGLIFLLGVMLLSLSFGKGPVMVGAFLTAFIWNIGFVPPVSKFELMDTEDITIFFLYFLTAFITGTFTNRIRQREHLLRRNEAQTQTIYEIIRIIASTPTSQSLINAVERRLAKTLDGECEISLKDLNDNLVFRPASRLLTEQKERAVALWVFQNNKPAGWSTATLPSVQNLYLPITGFRDIIGVLAYRPHQKISLPIEAMNLFIAVLQPLGIYLERSMTEEKKRRTEYTKQIESLRYTILNSISNTFRNPVRSIRDVSQLLKSKRKTDLTETLIESIQQIEESSESVNRIVNNILTMSQLDASFMAVQKEHHDIKELIDSCLGYIKKPLSNHNIEVNIPPNLPKALFDFSLMELLFCNILLNAAEHAPKDSPIGIGVEPQSHGYLFSISDERPPIAAEELSQILEKSYNAIASPAQETGLEWIIAKAIAERHNGWIDIKNRASGGIVCHVYLPFSDSI